MKTTAEKVAEFNAANCSNAELISMFNLAKFESGALVVGDRVFGLLLPKVSGELRNRGLLA
jgi:hypothetical protein